jgi:tetratricopeptide (TPR) repeat protein
LLERAKGNEFDTLQNKIWIAYDLSKLYAQTDRYEKAVEEAKQTVRQKREEWWAWHWLGKLYFGKFNEKAIACLCEAISCPHDEDKIGKLRLDLAALLKHSGDIAGAVTECLIVAETYEQRGWKFPDRLNQAMGADWFDSSLARDSNQEVYERFTDDAVEITFSRIEEYPASFVRDIKTRETGKRLVVFATRSGDESVQQVLPSKVAGGMELRTGDPVFLRVAIDGDIEYTLHCKNRKGEAFDCCAQRMGVISNHSRDGRSAGVYLSEKAETASKFGSR